MTRCPGYLAAVAAVACLISSASAVEPTRKTKPGPVSSIARKMTGVASELGKTQTGQTVQEREKAVVGELDELIALLEKECNGCKGCKKRANPKNGMKDSMIGQGPGGAGELVAPDNNAKDWAKLSDRERDRILQSMTEGFPPEYRLVLERYYRRLAEEKSAAPASEQAAGATRTSQPATDKP